MENLYYENGDGEISIYSSLYKNDQQSNDHSRMMVIAIDIQTLYKEKRGKAISLIEKISTIRNDNLMLIYNWWYIEDQVIFVECEAPIYETLQESEVQNKPKKKQSNEPVTTWRNYCKKKFSEEEIFDVVKRISDSIKALHDKDIIHRDIHPSRIQYFANQGHNGVYMPARHVKFNPIGMPFNFKKLLKRDNFSGHVNYSAPELIQEKDYFSNKVDVWSFGCCIYYFYTKKDPFEGKQTHETKKNILN